MRRCCCLQDVEAVNSPGGEEVPDIIKKEYKHDRSNYSGEQQTCSDGEM